jgi:hypothetical protein
VNARVALRTTHERADRSCADACFALGEAGVRSRGPALVRSERADQRSAGARCFTGAGVVCLGAKWSANRGGVSALVFGSAAYDPASYDSPGAISPVSYA